MKYKFMADIKATVWLIIATALSVYIWVSALTPIIAWLHEGEVDGL